MNTFSTGTCTFHFADIEGSTKLWQECPDTAATSVQLDEVTFNTAWAEGRAMTMEQAIAYALEETQ